MDTRDGLWRRRECKDDACKHRFFTQEVIVDERPDSRQAKKKAEREMLLKNVMSSEQRAPAVKRAAVARRAIEERRDALSQTGFDASRRTFGIR
jgi:hypothetical protein